MKLYTRKEFFKLQTPILFSRYAKRSLEIEGLYQCHDFLKDNNGEIIDYGYYNLISTSSLELENGTELYNSDFTDYIEAFNEFEIEIDCGHRDGMYDESQLFIVYDNNDIDKLVEFLLESRGRIKLNLLGGFMIKVTVTFEEVEEKKVDNTDKHLVLGDYSYALNSELKSTTIMTYEGSNMMCEIVQEDIVIRNKDFRGNIEILDVYVRSLKTGKFYFTQSRFLKYMTKCQIDIAEYTRITFGVWK